MAVESDVCPALHEMRRLYGGDPARGIQSNVLLHIGPVLAAVLGLVVDTVRVILVHTTDKSVAAACGDPVLIDRPAAFQPDARSAPASVILQPSKDPIRLLEGDRHVVELADGGGI